ncbi:MAG TPA: sucrose phosphorylase [Candidatus Limnocylindrales bacterium]|jgi:sucrose phosphorylase|nr:sucrose phosphorylase [Candidatus Limnocylindrales bacterium]
MRPGAISPRPQLLTYPDSLGGGLAQLAGLLDGPMAGLFHGIHVLPPFPSSGDRGFAPLTYYGIDARFGTWEDIQRLGERHDVLLDLMINHISRQSREFQDFERRGRRSPFADLFITIDKIWPDGDPPSADIDLIFLRKPDSPFSTITIRETGEQERVWTSFGSADWSEQVDLDITSDATRALITDWLRFFAAQRVRIVRLDAVGYVVKKPGTSCFMVEPEIYDFLGWVSEEAASCGLTVLPEVHDTYATHQRLSAHGMWTYDFVVPGLVLHTLESGDARRLADHLSEMPDRVFTTLDCHDGIPIRPDLDGILTPAEMLALASLVERRGGNANRLLSSANAGAVDVHQLNCTYYSALDCDDERYLAARAIQLFARGVPQIYYVGLLAGANDRAAMELTGEGRAVNRHDYTSTEIDAALARPLVQRLLELIRLRNSHPAFEGTLHVELVGRSRLRMLWRHGSSSCSLDVDVSSGQLTVDEGLPGGSLAERVG